MLIHSAEPPDGSALNDTDHTTQTPIDHLVDGTCRVKIPTKISYLSWTSIDGERVIKPRQYQIEMRLWMLTEHKKLLHHDEKDNGVIVVMPTGTGKTLCAAMSILDYIIANPTKKVVFVVDKVPLCNQQAEVLKMAFEGFGRGDLDVKKLHGGLRCPHPTEYDVLVAVAESFCQSLESNRLGITMFSLVVIDEIHHAVRIQSNKNSKHPYSTLLGSYVATCDRSVKPKVLGFTATPPKSSSSNSIQNIFSPLSLLKHSVEESSFEQLEKVTGCILRTPSCSSDFSRAIKTPRTVYIKRTDYCKDKWHEYVDWWELNASDDEQKHLKQRALISTCQYLREVLRYIENKSAPLGGENFSEPFFRCIVFVDTVREARCLSDLLKTVNHSNCQWRFAQSPTSTRLGHLNPLMIVGHSIMSYKNAQKPILESFRSGECKLLVCTSVLEEGIDVQDCNIVIRLDAGEGLSLRSYVQSRGRARSAVDSEFVLVCSDEERNQLKMIQQNELVMARGLEKYMKQYDEFHPSRSKQVMKMMEDYEKSAESIIISNVIKSNVEHTMMIQEPGGDSVIISIYTSFSALSTENILILKALLGPDVVLETNTCPFNPEAAPFKHQCQVKCCLKHIKRGITKASFGAIFRLLTSVAPVCSKFQHKNSSLGSDFVESCWLSYEGPLEGVRNSPISEATVSIELGHLVSPRLFKSYIGSDESNYYFEDSTINIQLDKGQLTIHFCVWKGIKRVWPQFVPFNIIERRIARAVAQVDFKDIVAAVIEVDAANDANDCDKLLITMRRPPLFFIETSNRYDEVTLMRQPVPDELKPYFSNLLTFSMKSLRGKCESIAKIFLHHRVPLYVCGTLQTTFDSDESMNLKFIGDRDMTFLALAPWKAFQSEYPWLFHQIQLYPKLLDAYHEHVNSIIAQSSISYWQKQLLCFQAFSNIVERSIFGRVANRGKQLFIVPCNTRFSVDDVNTLEDGVRLSYETIVQRKHDLVFSAVLTPSGRVVFSRMPISILSNRVLRAMTGSRFAENDHLYRKLCPNGTESILFLKLSILDEDFNDLNPADVIEDIVSDIFTRGVWVGRTNFILLHWSNSQMREKSVWMVAKYEPVNEKIPLSVTTDFSQQTIIRLLTSWLGTLPDSVCKYCSRLALAFSSSIPTIKVDRHLIHCIDDIENNGFCFTDGCGQISKGLADKISQSLQLPQNFHPSAFQIRFGGAKGVVVVNPKLRGDQAVLRKSQIKFKSDHNTVEVLSYAKYNNAYLNQQIILLLSAHGVPDNVFTDMMSEAISSAAQIVVDPEVACEHLANVGYEFPARHRGFPLSEPFFVSLLRYKHHQLLRNLEQRSRIFVKDACVLLGVVDDFGVLSEGEVFVQINDSNESRFNEEYTRIVESSVIVTKNPCLHPGDILRLNAVRRTDVIEKLGHLVNVLVFPARESMMRPHPDMISGSDLDGDMYFVSWNTKLLSWDESKHMEPMDFASLESIGDAKPPEDRQEYFTRSCCGANLGVIANAHKVFADQLGAADQKCIELAKLHSIAVDFPKVGRPANISKDLIPRSYPKWMKKNDKEVYYKETVLQKCSNLCPNVAADDSNDDDFCPDSSLRVFHRMLRHSEQSHQYYDEACTIVKEYNNELRQQMRIYGLRHEAELFWGVDFHRGYSNRDRGHQNTMIANFLNEMRKKYYNVFMKEFSDDDENGEIELKAVAWYHASYEMSKKLKRDGFLVLSLPWLTLHDRLVKVIPGFTDRSILDSSINLSFSEFWESTNFLANVRHFLSLFRNSERDFDFCFVADPATLVDCKDFDLFTSADLNEIGSYLANSGYDCTANEGERNLIHFREIGITLRRVNAFRVSKLSSFHHLTIFTLRCLESYPTMRENIFPLLCLVSTWASQIDITTNEVQAISTLALLYILLQLQAKAKFGSIQMEICANGIDANLAVESSPNDKAFLLMLGFFKFIMELSSERNVLSDRSRERKGRIKEILEVLPSEVLLCLNTLKLSDTVSYAASQAYHGVIMSGSITCLLSSCPKSLASRRFWIKRVREKDKAFIEQKVRSIVAHGEIKIGSVRNSMSISLRSTLQTIRWVQIFLSQIKHLYSRRVDNEMFSTVLHQDLIGNLPILTWSETITTAIRENPVSIIKAATGSGKSTVIPRLILNESIQSGSLARIICFQPRRIAAVSLASRVSETLQTNVGEEIGYIIGGDSQVSSRSHIVFCTEAIGMLHCLQETLAYTHIIIDEVHIRSIFIDVALAVLKHYHLLVNKNLRIVLMSASINTDTLKDYFAGTHCRIENVKTESPFPIHQEYLDEISFFKHACFHSFIQPTADFNEEKDRIWEQIAKFRQSTEGYYGSLNDEFLDVQSFPLEAIGMFIKSLHEGLKQKDNFTSKVLVFLPGRNDILQLSFILDDLADEDEWSIDRLLGGVSIEQQMKIVTSSSENAGSRGRVRSRQIILCTDVVESSVTIPECDIIIDTLQHKRFANVGYGHQYELRTKFITQDEALQRCGRTGRTRAGTVYRLLSRRSFCNLKKHPKPELLSSDITSVLVMLQELLPSAVSRWRGTEDARAKLCDPRSFLTNLVPSPPPESSINEAYAILEELGAFHQEKLGVLGYLLKELYFEPRQVLLVLNGLRFGVLDEAVIIASILQRGSPFLDDAGFEPYEKAAQLEVKTVCGKGKSDLFSSMYAFMCWRLNNNIRWSEKMKNQMEKSEKYPVDTSNSDIKEENQWCWDRFISASTCREIEEVTIQIFDSLQAVGIIDQNLEGREEKLYRSRKAKTMETRIDSESWDKKMMISSYRYLLGHDNLRNVDCGGPNQGFKNLKVKDREDILLWIVASSYLDNTLTSSSLFAHREVTYISRKTTTKSKRRFKGRNQEDSILFFLKNVGLEVTDHHTHRGRGKNELMHVITFKSVEDAIVASQLRPCNEKYPYKRNDREIKVTGMRKCHKSAEANSIMVISQETICDLEGDKDLVAAKILTTSNKKCQTVISFDLTVLPKNSIHAITAAMHPMYSARNRLCRFRAIPETMHEPALDKVELDLVKEIRDELNQEFVIPPDPSAKDSRLHFSKDSNSIIARRQTNVLKLFDHIRQKGKSSKKTEFRVDLSAPSHVGLIIGKNGCNIKSVEANTNCRVKYEKQSGTVSIVGKRDGIQAAYQRILLLSKYTATVKSDPDKVLN